MNNNKNKGRANSKPGRLLFLLLLLPALAILLVPFLRHSKDMADIKKDEAIRRELIEERQKDRDQNHNELKSLKKKYRDMVGWIEIPDTDFSYLVMQSGKEGHREDDPEFYLHANVHGDYSFMGTPFLDSRCSLDSDNLIIYGHNMANNLMFGYLQGYRQRDFYKKHPTICFTECGSIREEYEVVSVLVTDIHSYMYTFTDIYTDEIYKEDIEKFLRDSIFETEAGIELKKEIDASSAEELFHKEKFITLSTCRTGEGRDARLLVIARKIKD